MARIRLLSLLVLAFAASPMVTAAQSFAVVDIGLLPGDLYAHATDINNRLQMVGTSSARPSPAPTRAIAASADDSAGASHALLLVPLPTTVRPEPPSNLRFSVGSEPSDEVVIDVP